MTVYLDRLRRQLECARQVVGRRGAALEAHLYRVIERQAGVTTGKIRVQLDHPLEQLLSTQNVVFTRPVDGPARLQKNIVCIDARRVLLEIRARERGKL